MSKNNNGYGVKNEIKFFRDSIGILVKSLIGLSRPIWTILIVDSSPVRFKKWI